MVPTRKPSSVETRHVLALIFIDRLRRRGGHIPIFRSDHNYVFLRFSLPSAPKRGRGCSKFNSSLLKDAEYVSQVRQFWNAWREEQSHYPSLTIWCDAGKQLLREFTQEFSLNCAAARRSSRNHLETTLNHLLRQQDAGIDVASSIAQARASLQEHWQQQAQGAWIRLKEQWAEGETSTKYFFRLAASRGAK